MRCYAIKAFQMGAALIVVFVFFLLQGHDLKTLLTGVFNGERVKVERRNALNLDSPDKGVTTIYSRSETKEINHEKAGCLAYTSSCPEVQIVVPVLTAEHLRALPTLVKSLLYYSRLSTVKLHLVATTHGEKVLTTLFDTWELPQVKIEYYIPELLENKSFSLVDTIGIVLQQPRNARLYDKLIAVQPGMLFLDDILEVWNKIHVILDDRALVFLESSVKEDVPLEPKDCDPRGILLVDVNNLLSLVQLDTGNCPQESIMLFDDPTSSVDQKVAISSSCSNSDDSFNVTSEPIVKTVQVRCESMPGMYGHVAKSHTYASESIYFLQRLDGDIFRTMSTSCAKPEPASPKLDPKDSCYEYRYLASIKRRTHIHYVGKVDTNNTDPYAVTLVTQLMLNRMGGLERQMSFWEGPASVSLYLTDSEVLKFVDFIRQSKILSTRNNIVFHLVLARQKPPYPINYLRNLAIKEVATPYYMMLDVDFVPNPGLKEQIANIFIKLSPTKKRALVLPCFVTHDISYALPNRNKTQFIKDMDAKKVEAYHQKRGQWSAGHSFTDYKKWRTATSPYRVRGKFGYEPYVVVPRIAPMYHARLLERMRDKLTYTIELEKAGYELFVLPESFTVHYPHELSNIMPVSATKGFQLCTYKIYNEIIKEIKQRYRT